MELIGSERLVGFDSYYDRQCDKAEGTKFDGQEYAKMLEGIDRKDDDYTKFLLSILNEESRTKPLKSGGEREENVREPDSDSYTDEEANDPHYELFLKNLRADEKSYVVKVERNGSPFVLKYEGDEGSDNECEFEYKRKLRSGGKQNNRLSDKYKPDSHGTPSSRKEAVNLSRKKFSTEEIVMDPDYRTFMQNLEIVDGRSVYKCGDHTVVYEPSDEERNHERGERDDDWADDVKILDGASFYDEGNSDPSMESEFRQQLIGVLRKPYDKEEYDELWFDIESRKPEERHIELRHGRERSHPTSKRGKSYLDYHPNLRRQLSRFHDDKPKCLNLLRGFFFWLKKASSNGSFHPWADAECLAIYPESG